MSQITETFTVKADGVEKIVLLYDSTSDMEDGNYTNEYKEFMANGSVCYAAVASEGTDAYNAYGTALKYIDKKGDVKYVLTQPYFPECDKTYETPTINLSYNVINASGQDTITPTIRYSRRWTDSCGNSGVETGPVEYNVDPVGNVSYSFEFFDTIVSGSGTYNIGQRTGELTIDKGVIYSTSNIAIGTVSVYAYVYDTRCETTCTIWQEPTTDGEEYEVWNNTGINSGRGVGTDLNDFYIRVQAPVPEYITPYLGNIYFCESYEEAVEGNKIVKVLLPKNTTDADGWGTTTDGTYTSTDHFYCEINGNNKIIRLYDN